MIRHGQLLILQVVRNELGAVLIVVELGEGQLGWADRRADELILTTLVLRRQEKLPRGIVNDLKLACILEDMLKDQFFLARILRVASWDVLTPLTSNSVKSAIVYKVGKAAH